MTKTAIANVHQTFQISIISERSDESMETTTKKLVRQRSS